MAPLHSSPVGDPQEDILRGAIILARPDSLMLAKTKLRPDTVIEFARVPQREIRTAQPMAFQLMVPRGIQNVRGSVVNYSTSVSSSFIKEDLTGALVSRAGFSTSRAASLAEDLASAVHKAVTLGRTGRLTLVPVPDNQTAEAVRDYIGSIGVDSRKIFTGKIVLETVVEEQKDEAGSIHKVQKTITRQVFYDTGGQRSDV